MSKPLHTNEYFPNLWK